MIEGLNDGQRRAAEQAYAYQIADAAERVKIQAAIADRALQSMVIVQGGAMVALFTFVGNVIGKPVRFDRVDIGEAFVCFTFGLAMILLAHLFAFGSQDRFYLAAMHEAERHERALLTGAPDSDNAKAVAAHSSGYAYFGVGIVLFLISVICFMLGCGKALFAFI